MPFDTAYLFEWANLLLRWAHVVVAIAWIGSSFYFVFLDASLTPPQDPALKARGVDGELWAVHGGGFYHPQKYLTAPQTLPDKLHWFFWESYSTWLTGFALLTVLYLLQPSTYLIDPRVHAWGAPWHAVAAALAFLLAFWFVYDRLCRWLGERGGAVGGDARVGAAVALVVAAAAWAACALFAGRAAFVLVGAMLATAMSANVLVWIIPGQRTVIAQMRAGRPVEAIHGQRGKQRSVHNTYFTLPVLVAMLSNHYGWLTQQRHAWAVLTVLMLAGALVRHSFVARHKALVQGRAVPWGYAGAGVALLVGLAVALAPARPQDGAAVALPRTGAVAVSPRTGAVAVSPRTGAVDVPPRTGAVDVSPQTGAVAVPPRADAAPTLAAVRAVIDQRCALCHNAQVQNKGVALHTPELLAQHAQAVYQQAVVTRAMPINNATQITEAERALLGRWFNAGAPVR